jgi:hypothetical protein
MAATGQAISEIQTKYCQECGQQINRRAVICPKCGCACSSEKSPAAISLPKLNVDGNLFPMAIVLVCNALWAGLGNLMVGDKRGWAYGFTTWLWAILSGLIPPVGIIMLIVWFCYCSKKAYQYLESQPKTA